MRVSEVRLFWVHHTTKECITDWKTWRLSFYKIFPLNSNLFFPADSFRLRKGFFLFFPFLFYTSTHQFCTLQSIMISEFCSNCSGFPSKLTPSVPWVKSAHVETPTHVFWNSKTCFDLHRKELERKKYTWKNQLQKKIRIKQGQPQELCSFFVLFP